MDAELLAEVRRVLVDGEAQQDAARLPEVDRAEAVAVLDGSDVSACVADPLLPGELFVVRLPRAPA